MEYSIIKQQVNQLQNQLKNLTETQISKKPLKEEKNCWRCNEVTIITNDAFKKDILDLKIRVEDALSFSLSSELDKQLKQPIYFSKRYQVYTYLNYLPALYDSEESLEYKEFTTNEVSIGNEFFNSKAMIQAAIKYACDLALKLQVIKKPFQVQLSWYFDKELWKDGYSTPLVSFYFLRELCYPKLDSDIEDAGNHLWPKLSKMIITVS